VSFSFLFVSGNPADLIPVWIGITRSLGFMIGWTGGDETRREKYAEEQLEALRDQLEQSDRPSSLQPDNISNFIERTLAATQAIRKTLRRLRGAINQIHKYLVPVSKG
jgi:hypothetical protein